MRLDPLEVFILQSKLPDGRGIVGGGRAIFILLPKVMDRRGIAFVIAERPASFLKRQIKAVGAPQRQQGMRIGGVIIRSPNLKLRPRFCGSQKDS